MFKKKKQSNIDKQFNYNKKAIISFILIVWFISYMIYSFGDNLSNSIFNAVMLPILILLATKIVTVSMDQTDILYLAKRNQELYDLGIIEEDYYNKKKAELKKEYNSYKEKSDNKNEA